MNQCAKHLALIIAWLAFSIVTMQVAPTVASSQDSENVFRIAINKELYPGGPYLHRSIRKKLMAGNGFKVEMVLLPEKRKFLELKSGHIDAMQGSSL